MKEEQSMLHQKIMMDAIWERQFDRILYGGDLRYAPVRHIVKGVNYGNVCMLRTGVCRKDSKEVQKE